MADVSRITLSRDGTEQSLGLDALPLSIGGRAADEIRVSIAEESAGIASIGVLDGNAFIQTAKSAESVHVNGVLLTGSRRIADGDVIRTGTTDIVCSLSGETLRLAWSSPSDAQTPVVRGAAPSRREGPRHVIAPTPFKPSGTDPAPAALRRARPAVVATCAIGLLLLLMLWFSFTAVSVQLVIEPAPDRIDLPSSMFDFHLGERYLLRSGSYTIIAEKAGYQRLEAAIEVTSAADQQFALTMTKLPGIVRVISRPVDGALVTVDTEEVGITPIEGLPILAGPHRLTVRAPRHLPAVLEIEVEGEGKEQRFDVDLVPAWAPISIASDPTGASVWVDGVELGETAGTFDLDAGTRLVELRLQGHNPWKGPIEVVADEPQTLEPFALVKADAQLRIESAPSGAQAVVDNASLGRTPLNLSLASEVIHQVSLFKIGHELATRTIELEPGEQRKLHIRLEPRIGVIELMTKPAGATIVVDGKSVGKSNQELRLLSTPQTLVIRKEGYDEQRITVVPRPDFPQRIEIELQPTGAATKSVTREVSTALEQDLVLVPPGTFTMGSERGEPGRRPNETGRLVELTRAFYISAKEVTNGEFRMFAPAHAPGAASGFEIAGEAQPAVQVAWRDAVRFCNWLSQRRGLRPAYEERGGDFVLSEPVGIGYRLPTEAEWAWAARFAAGAANHRFPWGDDRIPPPGSGNYADASAAGIVSSALLSYRDGFPVTAPVGASGANELGLFDVGGNVAEWTHDRYRIYPGSRSAIPVKDPKGPDTGGLRTIRGSSWKHAGETRLRLAYRDYGKEGRDDVGFRIARYQQ